MAIDKVISECEIVDWWEESRQMVDDECRQLHAAALERAVAAVGALSDRDLFSPISAERKQIGRRLVSDVNVLNRRLAAELQESLDVSIARVEATGDDDAPSVGDTAALFAGGAMAIGSVGLAMTAGSVATVGTMVFFVPVATVSWPIFAVAASAAVLAAWNSPKVIGMAGRRRRSNLCATFERKLDELLLNDADSSKPR